MTAAALFPFGEPLCTVGQVDRGPKRVFVLGVYASAVHARWIGPDGKDVVQALAVASEPSIFWNGNPAEAERIIGRIRIPNAVGRLVPANAQLNGPSGRALDRFVLEPLGLKRADAWLCDLVPHSCMNSAQKRAIQGRYMELAGPHNLPTPSVPDVPKELTDAARRDQIMKEVTESQARTLILLGDEPIRWFLRHFADCPRRLVGYEPYGLRHKFTIAGREMGVVPLVHPRQAARLGQSSDRWFRTHQVWLNSVAPKLPSVMAG
jgi:uracil-DNA glycosylase